MFERAGVLASDDCQLVGNLASSYYWSGERDRAGPAFRRAIEVCEANLAVAPGDPLLMATLAATMARSARTAAAASSCSSRRRRRASSTRS